MSGHNFKQRWYDNDPFLVNAFKLLKMLDEKTLEEVSNKIMKEVTIIRQRSANKVDTDRVLGMYKAGNKRRNVDENAHLLSAISSLSTIPVPECKMILEKVFYNLQKAREEAKLREEAEAEKLRKEEEKKKELEAAKAKAEAEGQATEQLPEQA